MERVSDYIRMSPTSQGHLTIACPWCSDRDREKDILVDRGMERGYKLKHAKDGRLSIKGMTSRILRSC